MKRRIITFVGAAFICCSLTSCGLLPTEEEFDAAPVLKEYEGNNYNKVTVTRGDLVQTEDISGKYKGTVKEEILPDGVGVIKKIYVKKGSRVREGDRILQYELPSSEKALRTAENSIEKTTLQIRQARELMALEVAKLQKTGGSKKEIENVRNQYNQQIKSYESSLELTRLDAKIAKEEIQDEEVVASVSGVVTFADGGAEGTYGSTEEPVVKIEGATKNRFEATSKYASHCKDGDVVTILVNAQEYKAEIKKDKDSDDTVYFYPKSKLNVEDGAVCTYKVVLKEKRDVLYLPSSIVYTMGDKHVVYYEDENGLKSTKEVTVGDNVNNFVEITGGLAENEQVIAN